MSNRLGLNDTDNSINDRLTNSINISNLSESDGGDRLLKKQKREGKDQIYHRRLGLLP